MAAWDTRFRRREDNTSLTPLIDVSVTQQVVESNYSYSISSFPVADITCLRDLELTVPPAASLGETVVIECSYHLQGEEVRMESKIATQINIKFQ